MPELSRFYGIVVQVYYDDHLPAHFHVEYAGAIAKIDIETLSLISGSLPARARGLVIEWASMHQEELREAFHKDSNMQAPEKSDPLP